MRGSARRPPPSNRSAAAVRRSRKASSGSAAGSRRNRRCAACIRARTASRSSSSGRERGHELVDHRLARGRSARRRGARGADRPGRAAAPARRPAAGRPPAPAGPRPTRRPRGATPRVRRRRAVPRPPASSPAHLGRARPELRERARGAFEVRAGADVVLEGPGDRDVQLGARLLRDHAVGGVVDQGVAEPPPAGAHRGVGEDQVALGQPLQHGRDVLARERRRARVRGTPPRAPPHAPGRGARRRGRRSTRASSNAVTVGGTGTSSGAMSLGGAHQRGRDLLDEERVAARDVDDPLLDLLRRAGEELADERRAVLVGERFEVQREPSRQPAPRGVLVEQLRAADAHQQDRRVAAPFDEVVQDVQQRRRRVVQVVDDDDEGTRGGEPAEEGADRRRPAPRRRRGADARSTAARVRSAAAASPATGARASTQRVGGVVGARSRGVGDQLGERAERRRLPVGGAATVQDPWRPGRS